VSTSQNPGRPNPPGPPPADQQNPDQQNTGRHDTRRHDTRWPAQPDHGRPATQPPDPAELKAQADRFRQRLWLFMLQILGLVVVFTLPLPFRLGGVVLAVAALWTGGRLVVTMSRQQGAGLGVRGWVFVPAAMGLAAVLLFDLLATAVYYPLVYDQEQCRATAISQADKDACDQAAKERLNRLLERLRKSSAGT
jgi:hypothetical protein